MELTRKHYDEVEWAKMVLDKVEPTYQTKLLDYEVLVNATATLVKKLEDEMQGIEDSTKLGVERIRTMVSAWNEQTKTNINDCTLAMWT